MNQFESSSSKSQEASASSTSSQTKVRQVNASLFELYKPSGTPQMQVLFFHGLQFENCSADIHLTTWKCADGSYWPQTWLKEKFPDAHVLCVSYNGSIKKDSSRGVLDLHLVEENLISDLLQEDIGQKPDCPVILVGHSFGGLVIKGLSVQAHHQRYKCKEGFRKNKLQTFLQNIKGIFYYATPHHGSKVVKKMTQTDSNPLLKYFETLSVDSARLDYDFQDIRKKYDWDISGLGEGLKTKLGHFTEDVMVPEASSRVENFYTVSDADHFSICRPENKASARFSKLESFVDNIARNAEVEANSRNEAEARERNRFGNKQDLPEAVVGIEASIEAVIEKLDKAAKVGIGGMGGIGKTTLAKALFNKLAARSEGFEYSCFVLEVKNIKELKKKAWKLMHRNGKKVDKDEDWFSLKGKRLLLVLDDISNDSHLTPFSRIVKEASPESRVIVTSRDQNLLKTLDDIFDVGFLDKSGAKQLFESHAFGEQETSLELEDLVNNIVRKCEGLPLALEVIGKSLYRRGLRRVQRVDWEQTLNALTHANNDVSKLDKNLWAILRVSYDGLSKTEQSIFLDSTTFFCGNWNWTLRDAKAAWRVVYGIGTETLVWNALVDLSLVYSVGENETIKVHEQLRSLGNKIAFEQREVQERIAGSELQQSINRLDGKVNSIENRFAWKGRKRLTTSLSLDRKFGELIKIHHLGMKCKDMHGIVTKTTVYSLRLDGDKNGEIHISGSSLQRMRYLDVKLPIIIDGGRDSIPSQLVLINCETPELSHVLFHSTLPNRLVGLKLVNRVRLKGLDDKISILSSTTERQVNAEATIPRLVREIELFPHLEVLHLKNCPCESLPATFGQLVKLRDLVLKEFRDLRTLPNSFGQLRP